MSAFPKSTKNAKAPGSVAGILSERSYATSHFFGNVHVNSFDLETKGLVSKRRGCSVVVAAAKAWGVQNDASPRAAVAVVRMLRRGTGWGCCLAGTSEAGWFE